MSRSAARLFERVSAAPHGWSHRDLRRLLRGFGFEEIRETRHGTLFEHPSDRTGTTVIIPRHRRLKSWVGREAKRAIEIAVEKSEVSGANDA